MAIIGIDTRRLRYFCRIIELGSLSRAAEDLHVAQPALSQHLAALEADFGAQLLLRSNQGTTPTDAGRELYRHAQQILRQVEQAHAAVKSAGQEITGRVSIGMPPTAAASPLPVALMRAAASRYPGIALSLTEQMSGALHDRLSTGRLDLAVLYGTGPTKSIFFKPLYMETMRFVLPKRLAQNFRPEGPVDLGQISQFSLIMPSPENELRKTLDQAFVRSGVIPNTRYELDSLQMARSLLKEGIAPALLGSGVYCNLAEELDCIDFPTSPVISTRLSLCHATGLPVSEAATLISELIFNVIRDLCATKKWTGIEPLQPTHGT